MKACWFNGELIDPDKACVSVFDHGLLYGDGVFEGIRFYDGRPFRLQQHLQRLQRSARALHLDLPYSLDQLGKAAETTALTTQEADGYLRLVVTRGEGALGIDPQSCGRSTVFILADRLQILSDEARSAGASLIVASVRRLSADQLDPRIKSLNYLNQILGRLEANHAGADEAVMLNRDGFVAEGTADNLFVVVDGALLTPPVLDGARFASVRAALEDGPKTFCQLMAALGSRDGRDVAIALDEVRRSGSLDRTQDGVYRLAVAPASKGPRS